LDVKKNKTKKMHVGRAAAFSLVALSGGTLAFAPTPTLNGISVQSAMASSRVRFPNPLSKLALRLTFLKALFPDVRV